MKNFLMVVMVLLAMVISAEAETWYTANQHPVAWDAAEGAVSYNLYLKPAKGGNPILIGNVSATQAPFTLPGVGRFHACAQSVSEDGDVSELACSDNPESCLNGVTFGLKINPGNPHNLR